MDFSWVPFFFLGVGLAVLELVIAGICGLGLGIILERITRKGN